MLEFFKCGWEIDFLMELFKFEIRTFANIFAFYLAIFVGLSVSWQALAGFNLKMSLRISFPCIFEKEEGSFRFLFSSSSVASMLVWFLYFTRQFKTRSPILLAKRSQFEYHSILRLFIISEKKVFKTSTVLSSPIIISPFSINVIFWVDVTLSDKVIVSFGVFCAGVLFVSACFFGEILLMGDSYMMQKYNR